MNVMNKKKVRNSLVVLLACSAGLLTSCVSDELPSGTTTDANKLSVVFSVGDAPLTKADMAPTSNEAIVDHCHVVLFDANNNYLAQAEPTYTAVGASYIATFNDLDVEYLVKNNIQVQAVVVANSKITGIANCKTMTDFDALVETTDGISASSIVKEGKSELYTLSATGTNRIPVTLTQLPAKVKVEFGFTGAATGETWSFTPTGCKVSGTNKTSKVMLLDAGSAILNNQFAAATDISRSGMSATDSVMFYSYEIPQLSSHNVTVSITGKLIGKDASNKEILNESRTYKMVLDGTNTQITSLKHGNYYIGTGTINIKDRTINFTYDIIPWANTLYTDVNISKPKYLFVKDKVLTMSNTSTVQTSFSSSDAITISNIKYVNGSNTTGDNVTVTPSSTTNGTLMISSPIPDNFVERTITFTVNNTTAGLSENVTVHQYPPLYIGFYKSSVSVNAGSGQTNDSIYVIRSLIADFTTLPNPDEANEDWSSYPNGSNLHKGGDAAIQSRLDIGKAEASYIRANAKLGFPLTELVTYNTNVQTQQYENPNSWFPKYHYITTALCTVESDANNTLISPNFILASQAGANSPNNNYNKNEYFNYYLTDKKAFCAGYAEKTKDGVDYPQGTWRVPTKAELMLIDVLQNIQKCDVKHILEGNSYWEALTTNGTKNTMMDPRVSINVTDAAVRCVHDIK